MYVVQAEIQRQIMTQKNRLITPKTVTLEWYKTTTVPISERTIRDV